MSEKWRNDFGLRDWSESGKDRPAFGSLMVAAVDYPGGQYGFKISVAHVINFRGERGFYYFIDDESESMLLTFSGVYLGTDQKTYDKAVAAGREAIRLNAIDAAKALLMKLESGQRKRINRAAGFLLRKFRPRPDKTARIDREKHSELRKDEMFLCNVHSREHFYQIAEHLVEKRMGLVGYDLLGGVIKPLVEGGGPFPVFVKKAEYEECLRWKKST